MKRLPALVALLVVALSAAPAAAASSLQRFWSGFTHFWGEIFGSLGGVVGIVLLCGVVGIFIITRGKWLK
jgi:hypothetical protein